MGKDVVDAGPELTASGARLWAGRSDWSWHQASEVCSIVAVQGAVAAAHAGFSQPPPGVPPAEAACAALEAYVQGHPALLAWWLGLTTPQRPPVAEAIARQRGAAW